MSTWNVINIRITLVNVNQLEATLSTTLSQSLHVSLCIRIQKVFWSFGQWKPQQWDPYFKATPLQFISRLKRWLSDNPIQLFLFLSSFSFIFFGFCFIVFFWHLFLCFFILIPSLSFQLPLNAKTFPKMTKRLNTYFLHKLKQKTKKKEKKKSDVE